MTTEFDHEEVRCAAMAESDLDLKLVGEPRTCCVCIGHGCAEALAEIERVKKIAAMILDAKNHESQP